MSARKVLEEFKGDGVWRDEQGVIWVPVDVLQVAVELALMMRGSA